MKLNKNFILLSIFFVSSLFIIGALRGYAQQYEKVASPTNKNTCDAGFFDPNADLWSCDGNKLNHKWTSYEYVLAHDKSESFNCPPDTICRKTDDSCVGCYRVITPTPTPTDIPTPTPTTTIYSSLKTCKSSYDCPNGEICGGINATGGDNLCVLPRSLVNGAACDITISAGSAACISGLCDMNNSNVAVCITAHSKGLGEICWDSPACAVGICIGYDPSKKQSTCEYKNSKSEGQPCSEDGVCDQSAGLECGRNNTCVKKGATATSTPSPSTTTPPPGTTTTPVPSSNNSCESDDNRNGAFKCLSACGADGQHTKDYKTSGYDKSSLDKCPTTAAAQCCYDPSKYPYGQLGSPSTGGTTPTPGGSGGTNTSSPTNSCSSIDVSTEEGKTKCNNTPNCFTNPQNFNQGSKDVCMSGTRGPQCAPNRYCTINQSCNISPVGSNGICQDKGTVQPGSSNSNTCLTIDSTGKKVADDSVCASKKCDPTTFQCTPLTSNPSTIDDPKIAPCLGHGTIQQYINATCDHKLFNETDYKKGTFCTTQKYYDRYVCSDGTTIDYAVPSADHVCHEIGWCPFNISGTMITPTPTDVPNCATQGLTCGGALKCCAGENVYCSIPSGKNTGTCQLIGGVTFTPTPGASTRCEPGFKQTGCPCTLGSGACATSNECYRPADNTNVGANEGYCVPFPAVQGYWCKRTQRVESDETCNNPVSTPTPTPNALQLNDCPGPASPYGPNLCANSCSAGFVPNTKVGIGGTTGNYACQQAGLGSICCTNPNFSSTSPGGSSTGTGTSTGTGGTTSQGGVTLDSGCPNSFQGIPNTCSETACPAGKHYNGAGSDAACQGTNPDTGKPYGQYCCIK